jgi:hypothetical protein
MQRECIAKKMALSYVAKALNYVATALNNEILMFFERK